MLFVKRILATLLCSIISLSVLAASGRLHLPVWYTDNMVLPRERVFTLRGEALPQATVRVSLAGRKYKTTADDAGRWEVQAGPFRAQESAMLEIRSGGEKQVFRNVALGNIWLCSGQSNMEFELRECATAADASNAADSGLRLFDMKCRWRTDDVAWSALAVDSVQRGHYSRPTAWTPASPESASRFSAIGYYFGKALRDSLQVPIGLICNAVGGSPAESWVSRGQLAAHYPEILADWLDNELIMEWIRGRARKNLSAGAGERHPYEPGYLHEVAVQPLKDCPVSGILWYQGESNAHNIPSHERLFPLVVDAFRSVFGPVPFYYAQLSELNRPTWPAFRASQETLSRCRPGLGMIVTKDLGEWTEVHYRNKKLAGERFARLALANHYGRLRFSPVFDDATLRLDYVFCGNSRRQEDQRVRRFLPRLHPRHRGDG